MSLVEFNLINGVFISEKFYMSRPYVNFAPFPHYAVADLEWGPACILHWPDAGYQECNTTPNLSAAARQPTIQIIHSHRLSGSVADFTDIVM